jgi:hypothetical protein
MGEPRARAIQVWCFGAGGGGELTSEGELYPEFSIVYEELKNQVSRGAHESSTFFVRLVVQISTLPAIDLMVQIDRKQRPKRSALGRSEQCLGKHQSCVGSHASSPLCCRASKVGIEKSV